MTARDQIEQNRVVSPLNILAGAMAVGAVILYMLGAAVNPIVWKAGMFAAGGGLLCVGFRDLVASKSEEDEEP